MIWNHNICRSRSTQNINFIKEFLYCRDGKKGLLGCFSMYSVSVTSEIISNKTVINTFKNNEIKFHISLKYLSEGRPCFCLPYWCFHRFPICGYFYMYLKGVFAKNERGYRLNAIKKRFWSPLILLPSVASIRRKLLKTSHTE